MSHGHGNLVENNFMGVPNLKLGMWSFLGSECMFFGSLIAVYFFYKDKSLAGPLPEDVFSVNVTSISTFILLMSSFTMAMAVESMKHDRRKKTQAYLAATALLGASFVGFQIYEFWHFYHLGLTLQGSLFGSSFFVMTGFHGAHVTVGVIWLCICNLLIQNGRIKDHIPVEISGLYWHFVDIVWIIIFTFVYLLEFVR